MHPATIICLLCLAIAVARGVRNPGQCKKEKDCAKLNKNANANYLCISMRTSRSSLSWVSQCTPERACGGLNSGRCPSFNGWERKFKDMTGICAMYEPNNCITKRKTNGVECRDIMVGNEKKSVIYACMDAELYQKENMGFQYTQDQMKSCQSNGTEGVCNGHGTCVPVQEFSFNYTCACIPGYSEQDNCKEPISNTCTTPGQCGANGYCNVENGNCVCDDGYKGFQCSQCDPAFPSENHCNGNGKCQTDGSCVCDAGYLGSVCQNPDKKKKREIAANNDNHADRLALSSFAFCMLLFTTIFH